MVSSDDKGIEFVRRQAFPNLIVPLGSDGDGRRLSGDPKARSGAPRVRLRRGRAGRGWNADDLRAEFQRSIHVGPVLVIPDVSGSDGEPGPRRPVPVPRRPYSCGPMS